MNDHTVLSREEFRRRVCERDGGECVVPLCDSTVTSDPDGPGEQHHVIERHLWDDGGYYVANGASVCNPHHIDAEENRIPPHAFWRWTGSDPITPNGLPVHIDKWGDEFDVPPWKEHREEIKYPSTGHLPFSPEWDDSRVDYREVTALLNTPLVITHKMDGSNAMLVHDTDEPVRARNGSHADHMSFDMLKQEYWDRGLYETIPENIQIFGEWLYAKHSIHYGCECVPPCDDRGPELDDYFQVFGVYDTDLDLWLSWHETKRWAREIGYPTTPEIMTYEYGGESNFYKELVNIAQEAVTMGHEGIVVRSWYPFHYGQFERRVGKFVRDGHVDPDADHWSHRSVKQNHVRS